MERTTPEQQFMLARHGVDLDLLNELEKHGYARPSTSTYVRSSVTGTDVRYVREMSALGYRVGTLDALMRMANQGVEPEDVRALAALGYRDLTPDALVRLQNHSLDAARIRALNERAGRRLGVEELVQARMHGDEASGGAPMAAATAPATTAVVSAAPAVASVSAPAVAESPATAVAAAPAAARSSSTPLDGRWIIAPWRGTTVKLDLEWSDDTQWRRALEIGDLRGVTIDQLSSPTASNVAFGLVQDAGRFEFEGQVASGRGTGQFRFVPNREFGTVLRSLGVREVGELTDHQLKNLAFGQMSAASIRAFNALGVGPLTKDDIIEMAIRFVSPEYVREMRTAGVTGTDSVRNLVEMSFLGVTAQYAREMAALGYDKLSARELLELWSAGVRPDFVRAIQGPGIPKLSRPELIQKVEEAKSVARRTRVR